MDLIAAPWTDEADGNAALMMKLCDETSSPSGERGSETMSEEFDDTPVRPDHLNVIRFRVYGIPKTKGSTKGFPIRRKDGKIGVIITNDCKEERPWASEVARMAREQKRQTVWEGPVELSLVFHLPKPAYVLKNEQRGKVCYADKKPDLDKLTRSIKDAIKGILYRDDSQVITSHCHKEYSDWPGVMVELEKVSLS